MLDIQRFRKPAGNRECLVSVMPDDSLPEPQSSCRQARVGILAQPSADSENGVRTVVDHQPRRQFR